MKNILIGCVIVLIVVLGIAYYVMQGNTTNTTITPVTSTDGTSPSPSPSPTGEPVIDNSPTPGKPEPTTNTTVAPSDTTAVVTGTVLPNGSITNYWYEYGPTKDLGKKTSVQVVGSGYVAVSTPGYITGLTKNTTYYFRLVAENQMGTVNGEVKTLTTTSFSSAPVGGLPVAATLAASGMTSSAAILKGTVNPNKASTQYWFEIGKNGTLGGVTMFTSVGDGNTTQSVSANVPNLEPGTTYYYRINAQNQYGTVNGAILTFKTAGKAAVPVQAKPVVTTQVVSAMTLNSALLSGTVNPYGAETQYWFEYSTNTSFSGNVTKATPKKSAGAVSSTVSVQTTLTGLKAGTTYYTRIVAENSGGTVRGDSQSFQTK